MKLSNFILFIVPLFLLFTGCKKEDEVIAKSYYTDFGDTILRQEWANGSKTFQFDIDLDKVMDIEIKTSSTFASTKGEENYIEITPLGGYEIVYSDYVTNWWTYNPSTDTVYYSDTVMISTTFEKGDIISMDDNFTKDPVKIIFMYSGKNGPGNVVSKLEYGVKPLTENFYLGFRNTTGTTNKIVWLKISKIDPLVIILNSAKYTDKGNELVIG